MIADDGAKSVTVPCRECGGTFQMERSMWEQYQLAAWKLHDIVQEFYCKKCMEEE